MFTVCTWWHLLQAGPKAVSALCWAAGLRQLSLVGCPLGSAGASALVASLRAHSSQECAEGGGACWLELRELCVSGAGLSGDDLEAIFRALGAGGAPLLQVRLCAGCVERVE